MKKQKKGRAEIMAFYVGGAKLHAKTTMEKDVLEHDIAHAINTGKKCIILDTVNDDPNIEDDSLTLSFDKLLFHTVFQSNDSQIITPPDAGKIVTP